MKTFCQFINEHDDAELEIGIAVEMEHTDDPAEAKRIALVHLSEDKNYYRKLYHAGLIDEGPALHLAKKFFNR